MFWGKVVTFKAHSTRSVSTAKTDLSGASFEEILKRGCWNKNIIQEGQLFQEMVFRQA